MSADSEPTPKYPKPEPEPDPGPPPVRRPRKIQPVRQDDEGTAPSNEDFLRALGASLQALLGQTGSGAPPASEQTVNAKNRRFSARAATPADEASTDEFISEDPVGAPVSDRPPAADRPPSLPKPALPPPPVDGQPPVEAFAEQRRLRQEFEYRRRTRRFIFGGLCVAALAFLAGRATAPHQPLPPVVTTNTSANPAPAGLPPWSAAAMTRLNEILAQDAAGKLDEAYRAATELRQQSGNLPGLDLYLGNLMARRRRYNDADSALSALTGPDVPPLLNAIGYDQMGFALARQRALIRAVTAFTQAVANNPFSPEYYYHLGEALRRRGRQGEAVNTFEQALLRVPGGADNENLREVIGFKKRLTQVELGQGSEFQNEMAAGLQAPGRAGYWQLTVAAQALHDGRFQEAADALQKAKAVLSAEQFDALASDYYFRGFLTQPVVAAALPLPDGPYKEARRQGGDYFVDP